MELTYRIENGYQIPNLEVRTTELETLGKYAQLRKKYLKEHRRILYVNLLTTGKLNSHLSEIEQAANEMMETITKEMAVAENVTEELKATNMMKWVGLMNNIRASAEETILSDLIYS
ncbi:MAG: TnpV protein [Oscillospiraceae bacterium]|nr:TnpV protein [Oscillospiraceae bacterium]